MKNNIIYFIVFALFLLSCTEKLENIYPRGSENTFDYLAAIQQLGFDATNAMDKGSYYLVESDIRLDKSALYQLGADVMARQAYNGIPVSIENRFDIKVKFGTGIGSTWKEAFEEAMSIWNSSCGIYMYTIESGTPDIVITGEYWDIYWYGNQIAEASFPLSNGKPGETVTVNLNYTGVLNPGIRLYNAVHELGHCLGFRHTNWRKQNEASAIAIPGTPDTGSNPDPKSVMNGGSANTTWNGFSNYDKIAIKYLYPFTYRFYDIAYDEIGASKRVEASFFCKEAVEITFVCKCYNPVYNVDRFRVQFSSGFYGYHYTGSQSIDEVITVRVPVGVTGAGLVINQNSYDQVGGVASTYLEILKIKSVATGQEIPVKTPNMVGFSYELITKDTSGQV